MIKKKECVAMLLAGGQGSRLSVLTQNLAKPAVPFGGKYRIIDFTLSNCVNSHIDTVGVLTQYKPLVLNEYIGNGQPWGLDRQNGGVHILPPYVGNKHSEWYQGTANAVYQNIAFIDQYRPEYLLVLSGDHIYKMDYADMLEYHKNKQADCTVSAITVSEEEASRFGILIADRENRINGFEEKPKNPKSLKASMGIYIFNWQSLKEALIRDAKEENSRHDFGADIIPGMLEQDKRMFAYPFEGYWKDVGTIESLWQANMDLIDSQIPLNVNDEKGRVYTRSLCLPPHYISDNMVVKNSLISEGCCLSGKINNSVIFSGVTVEPGAVISNSVIMTGTVVHSGATISRAIVGEHVTVMENAVIGEESVDAEIEVIPSNQITEGTSKEKDTAGMGRYEV